VRTALGGSIVQQVFEGARDLQVMALDPELERVLLQTVQSVQAVGGSNALGLEPGLAEALVSECVNAAARQESMGAPSVLIVPEKLRVPLLRLVRRALP